MICGQCLEKESIINAINIYVNGKNINHGKNCFCSWDCVNKFIKGYYDYLEFKETFNGEKI